MKKQIPIRKSNPKTPKPSKSPTGTDSVRKSIEPTTESQRIEPHELAGAMTHSQREDFADGLMELMLEKRRAKAESSKVNPSSAS